VLPLTVLTTVTSLSTGVDITTGAVVVCCTTWLVGGTTADDIGIEVDSSMTELIDVALGVELGGVVLGVTMVGVVDGVVDRDGVVFTDTVGVVETAVVRAPVFDVSTLSPDDTLELASRPTRAISNHFAWDTVKSTANTASSWR